ncbi:MAG TPA: guanylate kinase [Bacteroidales bacterium]|nr:guanylate kinase [Bacteroidales bacterium]HQI44586.1 guanylate kinase [Bacteroidales bacterium]
MKGKLIILSAPSGSGKTTIVHRILASRKDVEFSVSACSRAKRPNEIDGKDYYFFTAEEFKKRINNNEFLEWEEVYQGAYYGTLKSVVEKMRDNGTHIIFDVDVVGGLNIKKYATNDALALFIMPPSIEELEKRLRNRSTETADSLKKRIAKATYELTFANQFDQIIINDDLEKAVMETLHTINNFLDKS